VKAWRLVYRQPVARVQPLPGQAPRAWPVGISRHRPIVALVCPMSMASNSTGDGKTPLLPEPISVDELIDDRALVTVDEDVFRIHDFVIDLAQRCRVAPTPANIALYGAWGSGKTSLGNLLEVEFKSDDKVAFGRFDAFKYAEVPLRRHFLTSVAASFDIGDSRFSKDLYETKKTQRLHLRLKNLLEVAGAILGAALLLSIVMAAAAVVISIIAVGVKSFGSTFVATLRASAPGIVIAAPIVGAFLAIAFRRFEVEVTSSAPSSDEEFEKLFIELVETIKKKRGRNRVVVFIDELDRCSPKQVGSVLETLRTFLDVKSCIFIVAADQQVLEHALTEGGARQATPADRTNPYYSSGSAYLDKIFHYQLSLPPLLPRRLSRFAYGLIEDRKGVWERVPNRAELVSVLVPTHVRSPRRAKTLLNTFASVYRLALRRAAGGTLDENLEERASEVAKLVCLRTEFPLFARDLSLDARLPEVVLELVDKPKATFEDVAKPGLSREAFEKAKAYAAGELPVADLLMSTEDEEAESAAEAVRDDGEPSDAPAADVQRTYSQQLIRYLERTRTIPGPRRDLIYLESSGAAFGLPAEFADRVEEDALDGRRPEVAGEVEKLPAPHQLAALRLLAQLLVEGAVGLESRNVVGSLFAALRSSTADLSAVADDVLSAINNYGGTYELEPDDLDGALRLALASDSPAALAVRERVVTRDEVLSDSELGLSILKHAPALRSVAPDRLSAVLAARLADTDAPDVVEALKDSPDDEASELIRRLPDAISYVPPTEGEDTTETTAPEVDAAATAVNLRELTEALHDTKRPTVALAAFDRLLALNTTEARNEAELVVARFDPIADPTRAGAVLRAARRRVVTSWPDWLNPVAAGVLDVEIENQREAVVDAVLSLWNKRFPNTGEPATEEEFAAAAQALARVAKDLPLKDEGVLRDLLSGKEPSTVTDPSQTELRSRQHEALRSLAAAGLIPSGFGSDLVLADLGATLAAAVPAATPNPVAGWIFESSRVAVEDAEVAAIEAFVDAIDESTWLEETMRSAIKMVASAALREHDSSVTSPLSPDELANLLATDAIEANEAVAQWLEHFRPSADEVIAALGPAVEDRSVNARLRKALGSLADDWNDDQKADLLDAQAPAFVRGETNDLLLRELRVGGADPDRAAATLTRLFDEAHNNEQRDRVLRLWGIAQPSSKKAQRLLVDEMFIPLISGGKGQVKLALDHFGLISHVGKPTQSKIKQALDTAAAGEKDLQKRINKILQRAQWIKRPKKWGIF
jgi:hypothetical protein